MAQLKKFARPKSVETLAGQIFKTLRAAIITGELAPGVTYSVPLIAKRFHVSATPVREAMLTLVKEGLVVPVKNKGFRIAEISTKDLDEVIRIREMIEVPVVTALTSKISSAKLAELALLAERITSYAELGDLISYVETDRQFHLALIAASGNGRLIELVDQLRAQTRLFGLGRLAAEGSLIHSAHEHLEILEAIAKNDSHGVEIIMKRHVNHARGIWAGIEEPA
jgi:DNA-binding GntR family transcriptional regulator